MENQIVSAILIGTIVMILLTTFLIIFVVQAYKWKKRHAEQSKVLDNLNEDYNTAIKLSKKTQEQIEIVLKLNTFLRQQLPLNPVLQSIEYYKDRKNIQVHAFITSLGIAVISDIDQMNYKIKLIAELGEPIDTTAEDLVKDLVEDTTPVELDGSLSDIVLQIIGSLSGVTTISPQNILVQDAKTLIENKNRICRGQLVSMYLNDDKWDALIKMVAFEESGTNM